MVAQKIVSTDLIKGKRAIRVYPPWDEVTSKQAQKTQKWQLDYFIDITTNEKLDLECTKALYQF